MLDAIYCQIRHSAKSPAKYTFVYIYTKVQNCIDVQYNNIIEMLFQLCS